MSEHTSGIAVDVDGEPTPEEVAQFYQHQTLVYAMRTYDAVMALLGSESRDAFDKMKALHDQGRFFIKPPFPTED